MDSEVIKSTATLGKDFVPRQYLQEGEDEYFLRNARSKWSDTHWRQLGAHELETLVKNNNSSTNWDEFLVTDEFDPNQIQNTEFFGLVRIGRIENAVLEHHDLKLPIGITNSTIISCDIGDDVAIHNVSYLSHYIVGDRCILFNIDEMNTTNHAKFGNGIVKQDEPEQVRIWLDIMNETGCRRVIPFDGMLPADAYIWAKYRDDSALQERLIEITQNQFDDRRGDYGTVGEECVIKNSRILKDVQVGTHCYIKGANKLKNLTINSSQSEPTQIGEGAEMVNGIIGYGCHAFYGIKAVRFILGDNSNLKYGARLINSFLGDNSTISCCEVLNNLIFPAHEQHHNNSFLIAAVVMGQSNMAAGATIGSNHNSRANDNELQAGRGFWPGLCTSIKHSCRFASFVLLSKADYPAELDIPLPFSLLNNNQSKDQLEIMPAYWWLYNMYALARNSWKFSARDKRARKLQHIEFDALAPDTVEEIFHARSLMEKWTGKAFLLSEGRNPDDQSEKNLIRQGREILNNAGNKIAILEILADHIEKSDRKVVIIKTFEGYRAYGDMLHFYAMKNILQYLTNNPDKSISQMNQELFCEREREWVNLGGQLVTNNDVKHLRSDISQGNLATWKDIHTRYDELWEKYTLQKQRHAFATLLKLLDSKMISKDQWKAALNKAVDIQDYICEQVFQSREKDYENPFRQATFRHKDEMLASIGTIDDNAFISQVKSETEEFKVLVNKMKKRAF